MVGIWRLSVGRGGLTRLRISCMRVLGRRSSGLTRRPLDLELQAPGPLNVGSPHTPRLVGGRVQGCGAALENGAEVTIAVVTLEANRGETVRISGVQDQDEGPEAEGRHPVVLELRLQLPDPVEPVEGRTEVAYTEVNVIEVHSAVPQAQL